MDARIVSRHMTAACQFTTASQNCIMSNWVLTHPHVPRQAEDAQKREVPEAMQQLVLGRMIQC